MPFDGLPVARAIVRISPEDQARFAQDDRFSADVVAGRPAFLPAGQTPKPDDIAFARWLDRTGKLKAPGGPSIGSQVMDFGASLEAGAVGAFRQYLNHGLFGSADLNNADATEQTVNDAVQHDTAVAAESVNKIKGNALGIAYGASYLGAKAAAKLGETLANLRGDPAFAKRMQAVTDQQWYTFHQRINSLATDQQRVSDEAANIAIHAGTPASELNDVSNFASVAADPSQIALAGAGEAAAGVARGVMARVLSRPAQLGIEEGLRAEVAAAAARSAEASKVAGEVIGLPSKEFEAQALGRAAQQAETELAQKKAALDAVHAANQQALDALGRPNAVSRAAAGAGTQAAGTVEKVGAWLGAKNQGVVDSVLGKLDADGAKRVVSFVNHNTATRVAGGAVGGAIGYAEGGDFTSTVAGAATGAALGAAAPAALSNAGRLARILGENYLVGRATVPYFARLATDAEANGMERFVFRQLDKFTPAVDFARQTAQGVAKGAAAGAALGYVASGGDGSDAAVSAGVGAALHFTPWAMVSSLHGFWSPVQSAGDYANMRAANLRALRASWAGSDNLARLDSLSSAQQLDVAHLAAANPDFVLRLVGKDDNVIAADQLANGSAPQDFSKVPGFHYKDPVTGRSVIVLNPAHPDAMKPVLAHELTHKAQAEGIAQSIATELVGDPKLGLPGMFTKLDEQGRPVTREDGSFETTPDFAAAKAQYEQRLAARGVKASISDPEFALEHAAEQGADFMLGAKFVSGE